MMNLAVINRQSYYRWYFDVYHHGGNLLCYWKLNNKCDSTNTEERICFIWILVMSNTELLLVTLIWIFRTGISVCSWNVFLPISLFQCWLILALPGLCDIIINQCFLSLLNPQLLYIFLVKLSKVTVNNINLLLRPTAQLSSTLINLTK